MKMWQIFSTAWEKKESEEEKLKRIGREKENAMKWAKIMKDEAKKPDSLQTFNNSDLLNLPLQIAGFILLVNLIAFATGKFN
mmetsp:Transcript_20203/g.29851  ORF Transcript_20203/g.29851 Transcript_20203/m.29851 type:complete len:82 (+) Transcript_20203:138-383(+)